MLFFYCCSYLSVIGSGEWLFFIDCCSDSSVIGSGEWLFFYRLLCRFECDWIK